MIPWHGLCCNQVHTLLLLLLEFCVERNGFADACTRILYYLSTHTYTRILLLLLLPLIDLTFKHPHKLCEIKFLAFYSEDTHTYCANWNIIYDTVTHAISDILSAGSEFISWTKPQHIAAAYQLFWPMFA